MKSKFRILVSVLVIGLILAGCSSATTPTLQVIRETVEVEVTADPGSLVVYSGISTDETAKVLNPGKTSRLHKGESTVALLDTGRREAEIITGF